MLAPKHTPTPSQAATRGTAWEGRRAGWRGSAGVAAAGGLLGTGSCGQGGRCVRASHATTATILSGKRDYFTPAAREKPSRIAPFSQPEPPAQGLDPATGLTPTPWEPDAGAAPQGHPPPRREQSQRGAARNTSLGPQGGGWPPWQGRQALRRAACHALSPPTKVNKLCTRRQRNARAAGRGRPGAGGSSRAPSGTAPLSGHGRDAPRRPPLSRTHHGIFSSYIFSILALRFHDAPPPPPPQRAQQYV